MIPRIDLSGAGFEVSRLAFGTARLHRMPSAQDREVLLDNAVAAGFTHFDTAPLYGFGLAEAALAHLRHAEITVATKVGLYPPGGSGNSRALVLGRKLAGRVLPTLSRPMASASVAQARASLDRSLARLGRQWIDLLFVHEPLPGLFETDEWLRWAEQERGRVRAFGLAGEPDRLQGLVEKAGPWATVLQTRDGSGEAEALRAAGHQPQLTYGHIPLGLADQQAREDQLARGFRRNGVRALLVSTRSPEHVAKLALRALAR